MADAETPVGHAQQGRPRNTETDRAILRAVIELMGEGGVSRVTVTRVARRAGVARATVYLRWPSRAELVGAVTKAVTGGDPFPLSGDLDRDIRVGADFIRTIFSAPYFAAILPEVIRAILANPPEISFDAVAPNRKGLGEEYRRAAASQGFNPSIDPDVVFDMLLGTGLAHMLATGSAPSAEYSRQIADVLIAGLRNGPESRSGREGPAASSAPRTGRARRARP